MKAINIKTDKWKSDAVYITPTIKFLKNENIVFSVVFSWLCFNACIYGEKNEKS